MRGQKKGGILLSYVNLVLSTCSNVFLTPMLITYLTDDSYSIYKVMQAFAGPLIMFNLGIASIVTRSIVRCRQMGEDRKKEQQNTLALAMIISIVMALLVAGVGLVMRGQIPAIYSQTYTEQQLLVAQDVFSIFVLSTILHILTDVFNGCALGHERFIFNSALMTGKYIFRILLLIVFIKLDFGIMAVTAVDLILSSVVFLLAAGYAFGVLREFPRLTYLDKRELMQIFSFSMAILLQAIVNQVNNNVDTILLGAMVLEKSVITMYSSALTIYMAYNSMISVVASFYLPDATKLVSRNANGEEITDFVIRPGRFQATVAVGILAAFTLFGGDFIDLWIGEQYRNAHYVALVLMLPVTIPLVENTAISILDATLKRVYRSVVLVVMAVLNVLLSIVLIRQMGFWGAALGTSISLIVGHGFMMNWYYNKSFQMNIPRMFKEIFWGILPAGLISGVICLPLVFFVPDSFLLFIVKCLAFMTVYVLALWYVGWNKEEKRFIVAFLRKFKKI